MEWTFEERRFLRRLNTPEKIQRHVDELIYNPTDHASSPRWIMITGEGHCFEGALLAAAAMEFHGHRPLMVDLQAEDDDYHVITVYKTDTGWGSISKSNTTLLRGRPPFFKDIHELVMSYFPFYFNTRGRYSLYAYTDPFDLNVYNHLNWRSTDDDLLEMGMSFCDLVHYELIAHKKLRRLPVVEKQIIDACFLGADPNGLYKA